MYFHLIPATERAEIYMRHPRSDYLCPVNPTTRLIPGNRIILLAFAVSFLWHLLTGCHVFQYKESTGITEDAGPRAIIPRPVSLEWKRGAFIFDADTVIFASPELIQTADFISNHLHRAAGFAITVLPLTSQKSSGSIMLVMDDLPDQFGDEAYRLSISPRRIIISARHNHGAFNAFQTLRQMLPDSIENREPSDADVWSVPCVEILDYPRFSWRGYMLDSARHYQTPDEIRRILDLLALHKINRFHWHLVDDQGWRLEIPEYPGLTSTAAFRPNANAFLNYRPSEVSDHYGGYYSRDDIRSLVSFAAERHITIVPEIEMPGHTLAVLMAHPELSCSGKTPSQTGETWIYKDVYCAGNDAVFVFLENVLDVVFELFPSPWIHVGGDEVPKDRWRECPRCRARIHSEGLRDETELQSYFMRRIEKYLHQHDRKLIGWDDIMEGGLSPSATIQTYREPRYGIEAANRGNNVIFSTHLYVYFDYSHEGTPVEKTYSFDPVTEEIQPDALGNILGIEACQWLGNVSRRHLENTGEIMPVKNIEYQSFPRLLALSEIAWSPRALRDWNDFRARLKIYKTRLDKLGVNYFHSPELTDDP